MAKLAINGGSKTVPEGMEVNWPAITEADKKAVMESLDSGIMTGPYGPQLRGAEIEFAKFVGVKYCLMVNSGTAALHLSIAASGIGPGDEVIVPAFTFLATALGALHHNAVPVFVDIDPRTFNIDPSKIEAKINEKTKAIMPVHLHGMCADMDPILAIAKKHNLLVIEDCAQAHGATYKGRVAGSMGDMSIFSVQASKNLPSGEGGFFCTNSRELAQRADNIRLFGQDCSFDDEKLVDPKRPLDRGRGFESITMGWQYLPGELPAALTRSQLGRLAKNNANASLAGATLTKALEGVKGLETPHIPEGRTHIYHKFRLRLDPKAAGFDVAPTVFRDKVLAAIQAEGVEACLWETKVLPLQKNFKEHVGYGKQCPWACPLRDKPAPFTAPEDYAAAQAMLDSSLVIGSHTFPIISLTPELTKLYGDAIRKVFENLSELF